MEDYSWRFSEKSQHSIFLYFRFSPFFASNLHHPLTAKVMPKFKNLILYPNFALDLITVYSFSDTFNLYEQILSTDCVISVFTNVPKTPVFGKSLNIEPAIVKKRARQGVLFFCIFYMLMMPSLKKNRFKKKINIGKKVVQNPRTPLIFCLSCFSFLTFRFLCLFFYI